MTLATAYPTLELALNARYRGHDQRDWAEWNARYRYADTRSIPFGATRALMRREGGNYMGIADHKGLKHLIASNVDQPMLEEICSIAGLERLELGWPTLATDLSPLRRLATLRFLSIDSPRHITDVAMLASLPSIQTLMIENAKHLRDIDWLSDAHHLRVIGIEGAMDSKQTIVSLAPLAGLVGLEAFLGTSLKLVDDDLMPLATCPRLRFLGIAKCARKPVFDALRAARPDISCTWFHDSAWKRAVTRRA